MIESAPLEVLRGAVWQNAATNSYSGSGHIQNDAGYRNVF